MRRGNRRRRLRLGDGLRRRLRLWDLDWHLNWHLNAHLQDFGVSDTVLILDQFICPVIANGKHTRVVHSQHGVLKRGIAFQLHGSAP
jgi:hypothetical protein